MNHELTNRFSWHRLGMVARFYFPRLKNQIILYSALSLLSTLLLIAIIKVSYIPESLLTPLGLLSSVLMWLGPAVFTMQEGPETETLLPAKGSEKVLFIMAYSLIGIPVLINLFSILTSSYSMDFVEGFLTGAKVSQDMKQSGIPLEDMIEMINTLRNNHILMISSTLAGTFPCLVTLFVTMRTRHHRIIWSVVWNAVYFISMGMVAFTVGVIAAIRDSVTGKCSALADAAPTTETITKIQDIVLPIIDSLFTGIGIYTAVCSVVLLILTYRAIINRQIS